MKNIILAGIVMVVALGCTTTKQTTRADMTVNDVIALSQGGTWDQKIIQHIDKSGTVFRLTGADLTALRTGKVSDPVVTYMLDTYTRTLLHEAKGQEASFGYGYGYVYPYSVMYDDIDYRW